MAKPSRKLPQHMHEKDGSYYYVTSANGNRKWIPLGKDLATAMLKWVELESIPESELEDVTFSIPAARFERDVIPTKSPKTQEEYTRQLRTLIAVFGSMPIAAITPQHVRRYLDERGAKVSANREKALLSTIYNRAREWGYTSAPNPCAGVKGHRETGRDRYVEDDEYMRVYETACQPLRDAMDLAYYTGQRPADVLKCQSADIKNGALWIRQNKTSTPLRVQIIGELESIIGRMFERADTLPPGTVKSPYLVQDERGRGLTYASLKYRFSKARSKARVEYYQFRDLRSKAGTDTDEVNGIGHAQNLLGHKTRAMTEHYIKDRIGKRVAPAPRVIGKRKPSGTESK